MRGVALGQALSLFPPPRLRRLDDEIIKSCLAVHQGQIVSEKVEGVIK